MKAPLIVFLLFQPFCAFGDDNPYSEETWMREGLATQVPKFKRATFTPHPEHNDIVVANCETDLSWWGRARVLRHTGDKIDWIATFPESYLENCGHYVLSCEWRYLERLKMWILEVFDSTHMGNGSLWLFALEGRDLRVLLHTTARGHFLERPSDLVVPQFGETCLQEEHLSADYRTIVGAAVDVEAVVLTGTIMALDQEGKKVSAKPYAETWTWDAGQRTFVRFRQ